MIATPCTTLVRARFGLPVEHAAGDARREYLHAEAGATATQLIECGDKAVTLITGPSGSGKTMVLRSLRAKLRRCVIAEPISNRARRATIDVLASPIEERLRLLGACGLADAHPLVTPAGQLSDGQKARLSLAIAIERAQQQAKGCVILIDEFCSTLDRATAASVAASVARLASPTIRFVCATAHDDLIEHLRPDVLLYTPLEGTPEILTRNHACTRIPGRSCPSSSESDSIEPRAKIPGRSASARERPMTTPDSLGFTTGPRLPRRSSA